MAKSLNIFTFGPHAYQQFKHTIYIYPILKTFDLSMTKNCISQAIEQRKLISAPMTTKKTGHHIINDRDSSWHTVVSLISELECIRPDNYNLHQLLVIKVCQLMFRIDQCQHINNLDSSARLFSMNIIINYFFTQYFTPKGTKQFIRTHINRTCKTKHATKKMKKEKPRVPDKKSNTPLLQRSRAGRHLLLLSYSAHFTLPSKLTSKNPNLVIFRDHSKQHIIVLYAWLVIWKMQHCINMLWTIVAGN